MKKLYCHTGEHGFYTIGKVYDVTKEDDYTYTINDDSGFPALFTKKPDADGLSFATWFTLVDEESTPDIRWKVTELLPNGTGGTLREERYFDEYEPALEHALQSASVYNAQGQHLVTPVFADGGDLLFTVVGKDDDFTGKILLERKIAE